MSEASYSRHPIEDLEPQVDEETEFNKALSERICRLLFWLAESKSVVQMGHRTFAMLYCLRPDAVDGTTLEAFGGQTSTTRQGVDKYISDFRDTFGGVRSVLMRSEETRKNCKKAQLRR